MQYDELIDNVRKAAEALNSAFCEAQAAGMSIGLYTNCSGWKALDGKAEPDLNNLVSADAWFDKQ